MGNSRRCQLAACRTPGFAAFGRTKGRGDGSALVCSAALGQTLDFVIPRSAATWNLLSAGGEEKADFSLRFEMTMGGGTAMVLLVIKCPDQMRAAAILGLGSSSKALAPFQKDSDVSWAMGVPASSDEADAILIFGGDGTIHRHLAQLVKLRLPVLVVPCGSGNDFARALKLRSAQDALAAWRRFLTGGKNARTIDLGVITFLDSRPTDSPEARNLNPETRNSSYFCCVGGVGLDGEITRRANRLPRWLRGHGGYALSLPSALLNFAPQLMKILRPDPEHPNSFVEHSNQLTVIVAFANTPVYGGGMKIAPHAQLDDGQLDVCVVGNVARFRLLGLFPSVYFGRHLGIREVEYFQAERLRIETEKPLDVYADGEYVCRTPIEVGIAPRALTVLVP